MATNPDELFADSLVVPAPPPVSRGRRVLDTIANIAGAGVNREAAWNEGLNAGSQYRQRMAQAESAMANADLDRERRMSEVYKREEDQRISKAQQSFADMLVKQQGQDPNWMPSQADYFTAYGSDPQALLRAQESMYRSGLASGTQPQDQRFRYGEAVQGRVLPQVQALGSGREIGLLDQEAYTNPLGEADIAATQALEGQRNRSPVRSGADPAQMDEYGIGPGGMTLYGRNAPAGQQFFFDPQRGEVRTRPMGDPQLGSRERTIYQRAITAANLAVPGLANLMNSASSASTGVLSGVQGGTGIFSNTKAQLAKALTSEEAKQFDAMMAGIGRQLAVIEGGGLVPSDSLTSSFNQLTMQPTDNQLTKLLKLAEMRQSVEYGLAAFLGNEAIAGKTRTDIERMIEQVKKAVPYTTEDILEMQRSPNAGITLGDVVRQRGLGDPSRLSQMQPGAEPAAGSEPVRVQTVEEARALPPGTVFITPDGRRKVR